MVFFHKLFKIVIAIIFVTALITAFFDKQTQSKETWCYSQFIHGITQQEIKKVRISADLTAAIATTKNNTNVIVHLLGDSEIFNILTQNNIEIFILPQTDEGFWFKAINSLLFPILLLIGLFFVLRPKVKDDEQPIQPKFKQRKHLRPYQARKKILYILLLTLVLVVAFYLIDLYNNREDFKDSDKWSYSQLIQKVKNDEVSKISIDNASNKVQIISKNNKTYAYMPNDTKLYMNTFIKNGVKVCVESQGQNRYLIGLLLNIVWLIPLIVLLVLFFPYLEQFFL